MKEIEAYMNEQTIRLCLAVIKTLDESIAKCEEDLSNYKNEKKQWKKRLKIAKSRNYLQRK